MISGAPSQDSLLPGNRHTADYQQLRERLMQELNLTPQQLHEESNLIQAGLVTADTGVDLIRSSGLRF